MLITFSDSSPPILPITRRMRLIPTSNLMLNYILELIRHESFHKKYAGKRFMKVRANELRV
jgi:hypothetical protein